MQIRDETEDTSTTPVSSEDNGVPIYSSLESLLFIPSSMSRQLSEVALRTQEHLDRWSNNRRKMVRQMEGIAEKLENWERGCAISTTVGSTVGVASGFAVIGGLTLLPPVAIAGLLVGTAAGISNLVTGVTKHAVWKNLTKDLNALMEEDKRLFEELLKSREELMEAIKKIVADEEFYRHFTNNEDVENKLKSVFGASVTGITGLGARFAMQSMGSLSSSLTKGVLHSVAVIGIVLDGVTLAMSVKTLNKEEKTEFSSAIIESSTKMEMMRQNVVRHFLNQDVWDADDDQLSDVGSLEMVSPGSLIPQQQVAQE